ncbi:hypothetical protein ACNTMW_29550 [Planosporangium sp. 12N6]|uniref:hypothetical protein n=1 Tax=Planosporangium spinosum TaxID=3402278 RepID=UPI003CF19152
MRRSNVVAADGSGYWHALTLDVTQPQRANLQVQVAGQGRLLLTQNGQPVLLAVVDRYRSGVEYLRTDKFRSPIKPLRAAQARQTVAGDPDAGRSRWAHYFATALATATTGPLQRGQWVISRDDHLRSVHQARSVAERWTTLLLSGDPDGSIDWIAHNGGGQVLPLRRLSSLENGRVKAYRKQVRDGSLPPILLWWISGLDAYAILDGHDRVLAAIAENEEPPRLTLSSLSIERANRDLDAVTTRYAAILPHIQEQGQAGTPGAADALAAAHSGLAERLHAAGIAYAPTPAWPLLGGTEAWRSLAQLHAPRWLSSVEAERHTV